MASYQRQTNPAVFKPYTYQQPIQLMAQALGAREALYNTNLDNVRNQYSNMLNLGISNVHNKDAVDNYMQQIQPKIKELSNVDFSVQSNVAQATKLFDPIANDQNILADMAATSHFGKQLGLYNSYLGSKDQQDKANPTNWRYVQKSWDELKTTDPTKIKSVEMRKYSPFFDYDKQINKAVVDSGFEVVNRTPSGGYLVKDKNGKLAEKPLEYFISSSLTAQAREQMAIESTVSFEDRMRAGEDPSSIGKEYLGRLGLTYMNKQTEAEGKIASINSQILALGKDEDLTPEQRERKTDLLQNQAIYTKQVDEIKQDLVELSPETLNSYAPGKLESMGKAAANQLYRLDYVSNKATAMAYMKYEHSYESDPWAIAKMNNETQWGLAELTRQTDVWKTKYNAEQTMKVEMLKLSGKKVSQALDPMNPTAGAQPDMVTTSPVVHGETISDERQDIKTATDKLNQEKTGLRSQSLNEFYSLKYGRTLKTGLNNIGEAIINVSSTTGTKKVLELTDRDYAANEDLKKVVDLATNLKDDKGNALIPNYRNMTPSQLAHAAEQLFTTRVAQFKEGITDDDEDLNGVYNNFQSGIALNDMGMANLKEVTDAINKRTIVELDNDPLKASILAKDGKSIKTKDQFTSDAINQLYEGKGPVYDYVAKISKMAPTSTNLTNLPEKLQQVRSRYSKEEIVKALSTKGLPDRASYPLIGGDKKFKEETEAANRSAQIRRELGLGRPTPKDKVGRYTWESTPGANNEITDFIGNLYVGNAKEVNKVINEVSKTEKSKLDLPIYNTTATWYRNRDANKSDEVADELAGSAIIMAQDGLSKDSKSITESQRAYASILPALTDKDVNSVRTSYNSANQLVKRLYIKPESINNLVKGKDATIEAKLKDFITKDGGTESYYIDVVDETQPPLHNLMMSSLMRGKVVPVAIGEAKIDFVPVNKGSNSQGVKIISEKPTIVQSNGFIEVTADGLIKTEKRTESKNGDYLDMDKQYNQANQLAVTQNKLYNAINKESNRTILKNALMKKRQADPTAKLSLSEAESLLGLSLKPLVTIFGN